MQRSRGAPPGVAPACRAAGPRRDRHPSPATHHPSRARREAPNIIDRMQLILVRHGETALNVARVLQPAATPLSARGLAQADAVARRLAGTNVLQIVSSDLPRAFATAQAIAASTGAPLATTPLLHERNFGDWRGRSYDGMSLDPRSWRDAPPGGESADAFHARVALAWAHVVAVAGALTQTLAQALAQTHAQARPRERSGDAVERALPRDAEPAVVVVTHGLVLGAMLSAHAQLAGAFAVPAHLRNTGISIVEAAAPHAARLVDCTLHLEAATHDDPQALSGG